MPSESDAPFGQRPDQLEELLIFGDTETRRVFLKQIRVPVKNIGAAILAAGESSRLGRPKQLIQFRGKSLIRRTVNAANEAGCSPITVVLGSDSKRSKMNWQALE